ncbi:class III signal peptide-containing protein [Methanobrevibacter curvatus]|uniref:Class III signal peptide n=1 Tax=Methanobrevibacter curvatus TaxID=49547 RepID=A0A165Z7Z4_9EURY|nr:class III signal peptide-containing protein [Methanobrevibacter curvatus]KZX10366.1 class III signal peptide [Methanobrevibacter curvatus]
MLYKIKNELSKIKNEENGQGAAEYILLFGGVIVIAIAALLIYRSYFASGSTNLNASTDVNDVRMAMNTS